MSPRKGNGIAVPKADLDSVSRWFEEGGDAAKVFRESLEAGGLITDDVMRACAAVDGLLGCGLERETLAHLIVMKGPVHKGGGSRHNMPVLNVRTVLDVFEALQNLPTHLTERKKSELAKRIETRPLPRPDGLTDDEWELIISKRKAVSK